MSQSNFGVEAVYFFGVGLYFSEMVENPEWTGYAYDTRHLCTLTALYEELFLYFRILEPISSLSTICNALFEDKGV
jgi:hypothetical protein